MKKLGFIGTGNIGSAIIGGVVKAGLVPPGDITASDINVSLLADLAKTHGVHTTLSNKETAEQSDVLFLCTKPNIFEAVINEISGHVQENCILVSVAAGISVSWVKSKFGENLPIKVVRAMPNIPAIVNCGMTALSVPNDLTSDETEWLLSVLVYRFQINPAIKNRCCQFQQCTRSFCTSSGKQQATRSSIRCVEVFAA